MLTKEELKKLQPVIDDIKAGGNFVFKASLSGGEYIYRSINRLEYRKIQDIIMNKSLSRAKVLRAKSDEGDEASALEMDTGDRSREDGEEALFVLAMVYPEVESDLDIHAFPAGVVTKIADLIMEASGFVAGTPEVEQL